MISQLFDDCVSCRKCRYGEFEELFNKIKKNYLSEAGQLKLGGKIRLVSKFNPDFIIGRRARLHDFTIKLMKVYYLLYA